MRKLLVAVTLSAIALAACGTQTERSIRTHRAAATTPASWEQIVSSYLPAGSSQVPTENTAGLPDGTALLFRLPSGQNLEVIRAKTPLPPDDKLHVMGPDTHDTTTAGSQRVVVTHASAWVQVLLERPNGTLINLVVPKASGLDVAGLRALANNLDTTQSDL